MTKRTRVENPEIARTSPMSRTKTGSAYEGYDNNTADSDEFDDGLGGSDNTSRAEQIDGHESSESENGVSGALEQYNRMAEEIQHERKVCLHFQVGDYCSLTFLDMQAPRKHGNRGHDDRTADLRATFTKATKEEDGRKLDGHICNCCR